MIKIFKLKFILAHWLRKMRTSIHFWPNFHIETKKFLWNIFTSEIFKVHIYIRHIDGSYLIWAMGKPGKNPPHPPVQMVLITVLHVLMFSANQAALIDTTCCITSRDITITSRNSSKPPGIFMIRNSNRLTRQSAHILTGQRGQDKIDISDI